MNGPWEVKAIDGVWCVVYAITGRTKKVGPVGHGHKDWLFEAGQEAQRRNEQAAVKAAKAAVAKAEKTLAAAALREATKAARAHTRSRQEGYRGRARRDGGRLISTPISAKAAAALEAIQRRHGSSVRAAIEIALIKEASDSPKSA